MEVRIGIITILLTLLGAVVYLGTIIKWLVTFRRWVRRQSLIYIGILDINYYRKETPNLTIMDNEEYAEVLPHLFVPVKDHPYLKQPAEYLIVKLDMQNDDSKENRILSCEVHSINPKPAKLEIIPAFGRQFMGTELGNFHELEKEVTFPVDDFLAMPMVLEPNKTYTKYLCIRLIRFPKIIESAEIKISMTSRLGKQSRVRAKFKRELDYATLLKS